MIFKERERQLRQRLLWQQQCCCCCFLTFFSLEENCKGRVVEAVVVSNLKQKSWSFFMIVWSIFEQVVPVIQSLEMLVNKNCWQNSFSVTLLLLRTSVLISLKSNDPWGISICTFKWVLQKTFWSCTKEGPAATGSAGPWTTTAESTTKKVKAAPWFSSFEKKNWIFQKENRVQCLITK